MQTHIENKTQKQIHAKIDKPYIAQPSCRTIQCVLERELPKDCEIVAHLITPEAYHEVYGYPYVSDLLNELIIICQMLIDNPNVTTRNKLHYAKIMSEAEKWHVNNEQIIENENE